MGGPNLAVWAVLVAVPLALVLATAFTKASVVLGALRVGLGAEALLPLPVVLAIALVVTAVVMAPTAAATLDVLDDAGGLPALSDLEQARALLAPLGAFLERHAAADELEFFAELQGRAAADPLVVVPAFLVTELTEALAMAVVIIVPLVLVDLLVAQVLVLWGLVEPADADRDGAPQGPAVPRRRWLGRGDRRPGGGLPMTEVLDLVRDGLVVVVMAAVPLLLAALVGGVTAGVVVALAGLQDPTIAAVFRAAGVIVALLLMAGTIAEQLRDFTDDAWSVLPRLGRGEPP